MWKINGRSNENQWYYEVNSQHFGLHFLHGTVFQRQTSLCCRSNNVASSGLLTTEAALRLKKQKNAAKPPSVFSIFSPIVFRIHWFLYVFIACFFLLPQFDSPKHFNTSFETSFWRFNSAPLSPALAVSGPCGRRCHNGSSKGSEATPGCSRPTETSTLLGYPPRNPAWFIGQNRRIPTTTHEDQTKLPLHREKEVNKGRWMLLWGRTKKICLVALVACAMWPESDVQEMGQIFCLKKHSSLDAWHVVKKLLPAESVASDTCNSWRWIIRCLVDYTNLPPFSLHEVGSLKKQGRHSQQTNTGIYIYVYVICITKMQRIPHMNHIIVIQKIPEVHLGNHHLAIPRPAILWVLLLQLFAS